MWLWLFHSSKIQKYFCYSWKQKIQMKAENSKVLRSEETITETIISDLFAFIHNMVIHLALLLCVSQQSCIIRPQNNFQKIVTVWDIQWVKTPSTTALYLLFEMVSYHLSCFQGPHHILFYKLTLKLLLTYIEKWQHC